MRIDKAPTIKTISSSQQLQVEVAKAFNALFVRKNRSTTALADVNNPAKLWAKFITDLTAIGSQLADPAVVAGRGAEGPAAATAKAPAKPEATK